MGPVREYIKEKKKLGTLGRGAVNPDEVRGVRTSDFLGKTNGLLTPAASTPKQLESTDVSDAEVEEVEEFEEADGV